MNAHTKEPWKLAYRGCDGAYDIDAAGDPAWGDISLALNVGEADARRIVACVNACAGVETIVLEQLANSGGLVRIFSERAEYSAMAGQLELQRDQLLAALEGLVGDVQGLIEESEGVVGLHLNGDVAPWHELEAGGRYERLSCLPDALVLLANVKGGAQC